MKILKIGFIVLLVLMTGMLSGAKIPKKYRNKHIRIGVLAPQVDLDVFKVTKNNGAMYGKSYTSEGIPCMFDCLLTLDEKEKLDAMINNAIETATRSYDNELVYISKEVVDSLGYQKYFLRDVDFLESFPLTKGKKVRIVNSNSFEYEALETDSLFQVTLDSSVTVKGVFKKGTNSIKAYVKSLQYRDDKSLLELSAGKYREYELEIGTLENTYVPEKYVKVNQEGIERIYNKFYKALNLDAILIMDYSFELALNPAGLIKVSNRYQVNMIAHVTLIDKSGNWLFKDEQVVKSFEKTEERSDSLWDNLEISIGLGNFTFSPLRKNNGGKNQNSDMNFILITRETEAIIVRFPQRNYYSFSLVNDFKDMYLDVIEKYSDKLKELGSEE